MRSVEKRVATADHLMLAESMAGELAISLAVSDTCRREVGGLSCVERSEAVAQMCSSCRAVHHANALDLAIKAMRRGDR